MIRVPSDEIWLLKRALDAGAHAIMVPQINTAASPKVSACSV
jgi:2-keto-3-deoxy-L-rhamnonate aldolase RhmA